MSFVPMTAATTAATAGALQKEQQKCREEEERMTSYRGEDLEGWEFKIVRSATRRFKHPEAVRQLCAEEHKAGWEMLEKFDDWRIRFKRRVEHRDSDRKLETDPYRTQIGMTGTSFELTLAAVVIVGLGLLVLAGFLLFGFPS